MNSKDKSPRLPADDLRLEYPATVRNRDALFEVIEPLCPVGTRVLEISSGSGEHAVYFASKLPQSVWTATDPQAPALKSIQAWIDHTNVVNVRVQGLDVTDADWQQQLSEVLPVDLVFNANMIHIAPWEACEGLMRGVAKCLRPGGKFLMYGPYKRDGKHTAPSNEKFNESLRGRDSRWGVRDLEAVVEVAREHGLKLEQVSDMPANNLCVLYSL